MKCLRILPEMCASTWCWFSSSSTRNIAFGSVSRTLAMTSIASSFAIQTQERYFLGWQTAHGSMAFMQSPNRAKFSGDPCQLSVRGTCSHKSQYLRPLLRDCDRVLGVRTGLTINCNHRPTVLQGLCLLYAQVNHGFDRENITVLNLRAFTRLSIVRNLRIFVHAAPDTVTDIVTHHRIAVRFRMRLDRPADVAEVIPGAALLNRQLKTFFGNLNQLQTIVADFADRSSRGCVAHEAFECNSNVYRKNVAFLQFITRRKSVHHLIIDRRTNRKRESVIAFERRICARVPNHFLGRRINFHRCQAGFDHCAQSSQHFSHELTRRPHLFDLFLGLSNNHR